MSSQVIFYDLPSKEDPCTCWSLNPWKTRLALNYKGIDYGTDFVEYPDIEPKWKSLGVTPHAKELDQVAPYTSPMVQFEDGTLVQESLAIAEELEKRYPTPSMHMDPALIDEIRQLVRQIFKPLYQISIPKIPGNLLPERSAEYFNRTRAEWFGMPLAELPKTVDAEEIWKESEAPLRAAGDLLRRNGGPFLLGDQVSYADFILSSCIYFVGRVDQKDYDRAVSIEPALKAHVDACSQWFERGSK